MTQGPETPDSPDSLPEDAIHPVYGNPTASHPKVKVLTRDQFSESIAAMFVQLVNQKTLAEVNPTRLNSEETPTITKTSIPIVRPEDLDPGVLLYEAIDHPKAVYEVLEPIEDPDPADDEPVELRKYIPNGDPRSLTANTLEVSTADETIELHELRTTFSFLVSSVSLLPKNPD